MRPADTAYHPDFTGFPQARVQNSCEVVARLPD